METNSPWTPFLFQPCISQVSNQLMGHPHWQPCSSSHTSRFQIGYWYFWVNFRDECIDLIIEIWVSNGWCPWHVCMEHTNNTFWLFDLYQEIWRFNHLRILDFQFACWLSCKINIFLLMMTYFFLMALHIDRISVFSFFYANVNSIEYVP